MPPFFGPGRSTGSAALNRTNQPGARQRERLLRRFLRDRAGTVGMTFGLLVIPLTAFVGLAVDFGKVYSVNSHTQSALDAAALAAGRVAQVESTDTINKASAAATAYFNQAKPTNVVTSAIQFSPNSAKTQFTVTATSWVRTPFLGVLNSWYHKGSEAGAPAHCQGNYFGCIRLVTTSTAELKVGGNGGSNIEVALMLDVTGSMCDPCTKITDLKSAAKDLIDIVVWDDQSTIKSRVALAPFADAVNAGTALAPLVRGVVTTNNNTGTGTNGPQNFTTTSVLNDTTQQPTKTWIRFSSVNNSNSGGCSSSTDQCIWQIHTKCVTERLGAQAYTDAAPGANAWLGKGYFSNSGTSGCTVASSTDPEVNAILPLTSNKDTLKGYIGKLASGGSTAGQLGTAWAWYLLSPKWNTVFSNAYGSGHEAGPYTDLTVTTSDGYPKLKKIAVLMTDGDYNINYCKGVEAKNSDQTPDINCNSENGKSLAQAQALCTAMKAPVSGGKIEVFTVGFQVSSASKTFLQNCATDQSHFYDATTGDALKQAFRDIALKISTLRLTN
jgi:Flp pilus assembly protein TadG